MTDTWYNETLHANWGQRFSADKVLFKQKTEHFDLVIFENKQFGRVMALDGAIQTTEKDEFVYHEMLTHVPLFTHGNAKRVLIVGGGDGGILREVCRHPVTHITMVEIDPSVIDLSLQYFPNHSNGAFDDARLNLVISDAAVFIENCTEQFDVIIVDSTDPIGPGAVLFTEKFYTDCAKCLCAGGIMVNQNGVPFLQANELASTYQRLSSVFKDVRYYTAAVPTYAGGIMTLGFSTNGTDIPTLNDLEKRVDQLNLKMHYYTPAVHVASFALPAYVNDILSVAA